MAEVLSGKTVLITGSTDGLGKLIAHDLVMQEADVLIHGRNKAKGDSVLNELSRGRANNNLRYYNGDFASFQEVKKLGEAVLKDHEHIDILINNVGIGRGTQQSKREISLDGCEMHFQVNYLSHVLLTEMLLPVLNNPASSIINVASVGQEPVDFNNLMLETCYDGFYAYKQSKTALIMYTFDLANRLSQRGIKVNAIHPASLMNTKMVLVDWGHSLTTVEEGAEAVEKLIFTSSTGNYFDGKNLSKSIPQTYDTEARAKLRLLTRDFLQNFIEVNV